MLLTATETSPHLNLPHSPKKGKHREQSSSLLPPTAETPSSNRTSEANLIPARSVTDVSPQWDAASTHMLPCRIGPAPVGATLAEIPEEPLQRIVSNLQLPHYGTVQRSRGPMGSSAWLQCLSDPKHRTARQGGLLLTLQNRSAPSVGLAKGPMSWPVSRLFYPELPCWKFDFFQQLNSFPESRGNHF